MGHFLSGSAAKLQWMAKELVPGWDACWLAGCTGEEVVKESCVDSGASDKPRCTQEAEPAERCNYTKLHGTIDPSATCQVTQISPGQNNI